VLDVPSPVRPPPRAPDPTAPDPLLDSLGDPRSDVDDAVTGAMPAPLGEHPAPPHACALQSDAPIQVLAGAGPPAIVRERDAFLVAAYDARGVTIVRVRPGALPRPFASIPLDAPSSRVSAPALEATGDHEASIVMIDGIGRVLEATFDPTLASAAPSPRVVAESGADARYAPALRAIGTRHAIAWTDGSATPMHLRLAITDAGNVLAAHDLTPSIGGGAAPYFVEGSSPPVLLFLDPRAGISVAHRVLLGVGGAPGATEVSRPLNLAAEPPAIAAARAGDRTWLAYAAVGNLATRAVGLVEASGTERPSPLVAGLGYGDPLSMDALSHGDTAIFAVEAPSAAPREAPHEVRVRVAGAQGAGDPLVLPTPSTDPSLALGENDLVALAYRSSDSIRVHFVRCAE
jgi:hypothetical protein